VKFPSAMILKDPVILTSLELQARRQSVRVLQRLSRNLYPSLLKLSYHSNSIDISLVRRARRSEK